MPVLEVEDLKTYWQKGAEVIRAVDGVSFFVGAGESPDLAGESGCDKTPAALSIMALLLQNGWVASGSIDHQGHDPTQVPDIHGSPALPSYVPRDLPSLLQSLVGCRLHLRCKSARRLGVGEETVLLAVNEGHAAARHLNTSERPR